MTRTNTNDIDKLIEDLYKSDLNETHKKFIMNCIIGLLGKKINK